MEQFQFSLEVKVDIAHNWTFTNSQFHLSVFVGWTFSWKDSKTTGRLTTSP